MSVAIDHLLELSFSERLDVMEQLWDSLIEAPEKLPIPDWHLDELDRREADQQRNPQAGTDWETVQQRLLNRHA